MTVQHPTLARMEAPAMIYWMALHVIVLQAGEELTVQLVSYIDHQTGPRLWWQNLL